MVRIHSAMQLSKVLLLLNILGCVAARESHLRSELGKDIWPEDIEFWGRALEESSMSMTRAENYDCELGCDLSMSVVCGSDGVTYQNECLAVCQNVTIMAEGSCPGDTSMMDPSVCDQRGFVGRETIDRYHSESFTLAGKRNVSPYDGTGDTITEEELLQENIASVPGTVRLMERRLAADRFEYVGEIDVIDGLTDLIEVPPYDPLVQNDTNRELAIYLADSRSKVRDTTVYPYRVAGEMDYRVGGGLCSGTAISSNAIMTAGHCLHRGRGGTWLDHTTFSPGRYRDSFGGIVNPYGSFAYETMSIYEEWAGFSRTTHDIGVVRYSPRPSDGQMLGDLVGFAGLRLTPWDSSALASCSMRGYPGDKRNGEMWTTGRCDRSFQRATSILRVRHYCDTTPGMSGSAVMDDEGYASAVHTTAVTNGITGEFLYNVATLLYDIHWTQVLSWADVSV